MYFSQFPKTYYTFDERTATLITNFMKRVSLSDEIRNSSDWYEPYTLVDGETPEVVADMVYQNSQLHWIILLTNDIVDPRYDWCLSEDHLIKKCLLNYDDMYAVHHYEVDGLIVDFDYPGAVSVSNYQHESQINETKRTIKIMVPSLVASFVSEFEATMNG